MGLLQNEEYNVDSNNPNYQTNQEDTFSESLSKDEATETETIIESFKLKKSNYVHNNPPKRPAQQNTTKAVSLNVDNVKNINQQADEFIETLPDGSLKCTHCGKIASKGNNGKGNMRNHVETHLEGNSFDCQLCGKTFRSRNSFNTHRYTKHRSTRM